MPPCQVPLTDVVPDGASSTSPQAHTSPLGGSPAGATGPRTGAGAHALVGAREKQVDRTGHVAGDVRSCSCWLEPTRTGPQQAGVSEVVGAVAHSGTLGLARTHAGRRTHTHARATAHSIPPGAIQAQAHSPQEQGMNMRPRHSHMPGVGSQTGFLPTGEYAFHSLSTCG